MVRNDYKKELRRNAQVYAEGMLASGPWPTPKGMVLAAYLDGFKAAFALVVQTIEDSRLVDTKEEREIERLVAASIDELMGKGLLVQNDKGEYRTSQAGKEYLESMGV